MPRTKDNRKASDAAYRERNREKIRQGQKAYYQQNKEKWRAYQAENSEKIAAYQAEWREQNWEEKQTSDAAYYQKNKETIAVKQVEYQRVYRTTPAGKKSSRVGSWKSIGIIPDPLTWDELYDKYISEALCADCECELEEGLGSTARNLDHDHETGLVRDVVCHGCNVRRA